MKYKSTNISYMKYEGLGYMEHESLGYTGYESLGYTGHESPRLQYDLLITLIRKFRLYECPRSYEI